MSVSRTAGAMARPEARHAGWRPLFEQAADRADCVQQGLRATIESELALHEKSWPRALPQGVLPEKS